MDIRAIFGEALTWFANDMNRGMYVLAGIAILGALNGIRHSLKRCSQTRNIGRRVL